MSAAEWEQGEADRELYFVLPGTDLIRVIFRPGNLASMMTSCLKFSTDRIQRGGAERVFLKEGIGWGWGQG